MARSSKVTLEAEGMPCIHSERKVPALYGIMLSRCLLTRDLLQEWRWLEMMFRKVHKETKAMIARLHSLRTLRPSFLVVS